MDSIGQALLQRLKIFDEDIKSQIKVNDKYIECNYKLLEDIKSLEWLDIEWLNSIYKGDITFKILNNNLYIKSNDRISESMWCNTITYTITYNSMKEQIKSAIYLIFKKYIECLENKI